MELLNAQSKATAEAERQYVEKAQKKADEFKDMRKEQVAAAQKTLAVISRKIPSGKPRTELSIMQSKIIEDLFKATTEVQFSRYSAAQDSINATVEDYEKSDRHRQRIEWFAIGTAGIILLLFIVLALIPATISIETEFIERTTPIGIPTGVIIWSFIGGLIALLTQFNQVKDTDSMDIIRWGITRPVTGIATGILLYLILKLGLIAVEPEAGTQLDGSLLVILVSLIGGFSDPLENTVLQNVFARFGREQNNDVRVPTPRPDNSDFVDWLLSQMSEVDLETLEERDSSLPKTS